MTEPETLEQRLAADLRSLADDLLNDNQTRDLYRALTRTRWSRGDGAVSLSFTAAEELLNELRDELGQPALDLAQTGGEGDVEDWVAEALAEHGWAVEPLDTSRHDDAHLESAGGAPPTEPQDTLADAHREADERPPVPRQGTPGR
jgi:hypothetical protein